MSLQSSQLKSTLTKFFESQCRAKYYIEQSHDGCLINYTQLRVVFYLVVCYIFQRFGLRCILKTSIFIPHISFNLYILYGTLLANCLMVQSIHELVYPPPTFKQLSLPLSSSLLELNQQVRVILRGHQLCRALSPELINSVVKSI